MPYKLEASLRQWTDEFSWNRLCYLLTLYWAISYFCERKGVSDGVCFSERCKASDNIQKWPPRPRSAQGWATISPQNVPSWGRSYKQPTHSELKLPLFIWRGFYIVTCTARTKQASGPPAPTETPQREPGVRCCSIVGGMAPEPRAETTLSYPAQTSPCSNSLPTHPLLPLWGWRTKRGFCRFRRPFFLSFSFWKPGYYSSSL